MNDSGPEAPRPRDDRKEFRQYLRLSTLGLEIGLALAIGVLIGWILDRLFGTQPWLTLAFAFFGIIAGFRNIIHLAQKDWDEDEGGPNRG